MNTKKLTNRNLVRTAAGSPQPILQNSYASE